MHKVELVKVLSEKTGESKVKATAFLEAFIETVSTSLANGEDVTITGFGKFKVRHVEERNGRNPQTGEAIKIPAKKSPAFKAGKLLKDLVK